MVNTGPVFGDGFAGGGGWTIAAHQAGLRPAWAIEYDAAIAAHHSCNLPGNVICSRIQNINLSTLERVDFAAFSPVCKKFSLANQDGVEGPEEISQAEAIAAIIRYQRPRAILIENVIQYRKSRSVEILRKCLAECGYWWDENILNSADYGVPQTRKRFILRALLGKPLPPLPSPVPWKGWYGAIQDLIPTLPDSQFAPWQLARLPADMPGHACFGANESADHKGRGYNKVPVRTSSEPALTVTAHRNSQVKAFLQMTGNTQLAKPSGTGVLFEEEPANTVCSNSGRNARAFLPGTHSAQLGLFPEGFLIDGQDASRAITVRSADEPSHTVTAQNKGFARALLVDNVNCGSLARPNPRRDDEPAMTITTTQSPRAWLVNDQYNSPNTDA
jgi:site-specific DNA-cytosine methylase